MARVLAPARLCSRDRVLLTRQFFRQPFLTAWLAAFAQWQRRQRSVQRVRRQVEVTQHTPKQCDANLGFDELLKRFTFFLGFAFSLPDDHKNTGLIVSESALRAHAQARKNWPDHRLSRAMFSEPEMFADVVEDVYFSGR